VKVLHIVHWPRSGIGVVLRDLVRHRSPDIQHAVICLAPGSPMTDQIRAAGADVYELAQTATSWLRSVAMLKERLRRDAADLVHSHSITPRVLAAVVGTGIPHVTTVHAAYLYFQAPGLRNVLKRLIECAAARRLNGPYVCVSEDVARSLPCQAMASRALVIANGIDIEAARAGAHGPEAPVHGDPLLVAVGRLEWEKGFDRLLMAVNAIRFQFPRLRLVICGDGGKRAALEAQVQDLGLGQVVRFTGHVENPMPFFRAADAFVSSSLQEGFALTAAEAMALGRPVISTPASGVSSVLRDGENAILASGFSPDDIASALLRALSDRERLQRVAEAGQRFAEGHLDVRRAVAEYERLYRDVLERAKE
jgi:glycosyltransferase involved in cell wall biosynthesis